MDNSNASKCFVVVALAGVLVLPSPFAVRQLFPKGSLENEEATPRHERRGRRLDEGHNIVADFSYRAFCVQNGHICGMYWIPNW